MLFQIIVSFFFVLFFFSFSLCFFLWKMQDSIEPPRSIKEVKENLAILEVIIFKKANKKLAKHFNREYIWDFFPKCCEFFYSFNFFFNLQEILHAEPNSPMSPEPLVEAVKSEIYPVIDEFIKDSRIVISIIYSLFSFLLFSFLMFPNVLFWFVCKFATRWSLTSTLKIRRSKVMWSMTCLKNLKTKYVCFLALNALLSFSSFFLHSIFFAFFPAFLFPCVFFRVSCSAFLFPCFIPFSFPSNFF